MTLYVKLRSKRIGPDHVQEDIFIGNQEGSLAHAGTLTLNIGEWQDFGCALLMGADQMNLNRKRQHQPPELIVTTEGDHEVVCSERAAGRPCECPPPL